jgi:hypothetical protein
MSVVVLIWIECKRSRRFALKLIDLSVFNLPKNLTALLVGIRIVHLLLINLELKEQLEHGLVIKLGIGYRDKGIVVKLHCQ